MRVCPKSASASGRKAAKESLEPLEELMVGRWLASHSLHWVEASLCYEEMPERAFIHKGFSQCRFQRFKDKDKVLLESSIIQFFSLL